MKSRLLLVLMMIMAAGLFTACTIVQGSGVLKTEEMDFTDFTRVEVGSAFEVEIVQSDQFSVTITADDNLFEYIQVSKQGATLKIGIKPMVSFRSATYQAEITMPELVALELSGATDGTIIGFESTEDLDINVSGASSLEMEEILAGDVTCDISGASCVGGELDAGDVEFDLSGASSLRLQGSAGDMELDLSGASSAELDDFPASGADVNLSGASRADVYVDGMMDVNLSGASELTYAGNTTISDINLSGGSTIRSR